jgi:hypothetical protein
MATSYVVNHLLRKPHGYKRMQHEPFISSSTIRGDGCRSIGLGQKIAFPLVAFPPIADE